MIHVLRKWERQWQTETIPIDNFFAPGGKGTENGNGNGNGNGGGNGCVDTWIPETEMCPGDFNAGYAGENSASRDRGYIQLNPDTSNGNPGLEAEFWVTITARIRRRSGSAT